MTVELSFSKGEPLPLGPTILNEEINFSIYSKYAHSVTLYLYDYQTGSLIKEFPLDSKIHRTGQVWHVRVHKISLPIIYGFKVKGNDSSFSTDEVLLDPYAKKVHSSTEWGTQKQEYRPLGVVASQVEFDWQGVENPGYSKQDLVLYEMHVRGFTQHSSSRVANSGKFLGIIEKIPYLLDLGVNAIELLPCQEFNENEYLKIYPKANPPLCNYWGYTSLQFFSPTQRYIVGKEAQSAILEFKTLVRELHRNGIEIILDVVFNHTGEGGRSGWYFSFKGLDPFTYYILNSKGEFQDYTGCGNTMNCNHPVVRDWLINCLHYWVLEMRVDGFRFDLASALSRGQNGEPMALSSILESISQDPILATIKLIAEPWDAAGLYQVGSFCAAFDCWSEWNGKYRDAVRRFIKGDPGSKGEFVTRLCGSQDLYHSRSPTCSLNFITCHDGFTLADLVSYNQKHNELNQENNRDGMNENDSWNCGEEGETEDPDILFLRERQMRNFHLALMVSQGVPMLLMGDEYQHTKKGNNNTWCQDNELNWFLWDQLNKKQSFYRYFSKLIAFRKKNRLLKRNQFLTPKDVEWHGLKPNHPRWEIGDLFIAFTLRDREKGEDLYCAFNANGEEVEVTFPTGSDSQPWHWIINTTERPPRDLYDESNAPKVLEATYKMMARSALLLKRF